MVHGRKTAKAGSTPMGSIAVTGAIVGVMVWVGDGGVGDSIFVICIHLFLTPLVQTVYPLQIVLSI